MGEGGLSLQGDLHRLPGAYGKIRKHLPVVMATGEDPGGAVEASKQEPTPAPSCKSAQGGIKEPIKLPAPMIKAHVGEMGKMAWLRRGDGQRAGPWWVEVGGGVQETD